MMNARKARKQIERKQAREFKERLQRLIMVEQVELDQLVGADSIFSLRESNPIALKPSSLSFKTDQIQKEEDRHGSEAR